MRPNCRSVRVVFLVLGLSQSLPAVAQTYTWDGGLAHNNFTFNNFWSTPNN
jgi:hypothetical protein